MAEIPEYLQKVVNGEIPPPPIERTLGYSLTEVSRGWAVIEMDVDERHTNPFGLVHGGLICDLADSACGAAAHSTLQGNQTCTTLEIKVSFLKPAPLGHLRAEARVIGNGQKVCFTECNVTDEKGNLIARATSTLMKAKADLRAGIRED